MSFQAVSCLCLVFFAANSLAAITRIVGGREATINEFPFQVSLRLNGKHFCGGSIIGEQHVLTAAHCVRGILQAPYTNLAVHTGSTFSIGNLGKSYKVKRADVHHGYVGTAASSYHNDIAVLTLTEKIAFDEVTRKIELPSKDVHLGEQATVSGWGIRKYPSSDTSAFLQKASMKIVPSGSCAQYLHPQRLHREQVCAILRKGVGACSGDSGGPLAANNEVIGIASWVVPCGEGYPDVYTKVYAYKDWLKGIMAKA